MKSVCYIKQRDYVGGGDLEYYQLSHLPSLEELFDNNFKGIRTLYDNEDTRNKYGIELMMSNEEVKDRFGDNDIVINSIQVRGNNKEICETSFNDVISRPYVKVYDKPDIIVVDPSKNITSLDIFIDNSKIFSVYDETRNGNEFINPILIDTSKRDIYLYKEKGVHDAKHKARWFYDVKFIDIDLT